jgi:hypothetical protein
MNFRGFRVKTLFVFPHLAVAQACTLESVTRSCAMHGMSKPCHVNKLSGDGEIDSRRKCWLRDISCVKQMNLGRMLSGMWSVGFAMTCADSRRLQARISEQ